MQHISITELTAENVHHWPYFQHSVMKLAYCKAVLARVQW